MVKKAKPMKSKMNWHGCCGGSGGFPTFAIIILVLGVLWLLEGVGAITIDIPWFPIILIIFALGLIFNHVRKK